MKSPTLVLLCAIALLGGANATRLAAQTPPAPPAAPAASGAEKKSDETPLTLPGAETLVYRTVKGIELRLHIVKPKGWTASDKRPAFVAYFGGGWNSGTPESSVRYAKWAAGLGLVGIAPDYRTRNRFSGTPEDCVADARAAFDWVAKHAAELGVDPAKLVAQGGSAGGHLAAWT
ncbi:MAG: alpha/beta hydrolase, partial [Burkholderiales bacterium]|nr:alpha/beta hydrolase [Opitutaceae bacterium]